MHCGGQVKSRVCQLRKVTTNKMFNGRFWSPLKKVSEVHLPGIALEFSTLPHFVDLPQKRRFN